MTLRAVIIGLLLAFGISSFTYFNDHIIRQTYLIGNHFPIGVFGFLILLVMVVNPIIKRVRGGIGLKTREFGVIAALGLAACGWPGSSFFRAFSPLISVPQNYEQTMTAWKATKVMSYVPGGSPLLGEGHIRNWDAFVEKVAIEESVPEAVVASDAPDEGQSAKPATTPAQRVWHLLPDNLKSILVSLAKDSEKQLDPGMKMMLLNGLNEIVRSPNLYTEDAFGSVKLPEEISGLKSAVLSGDASDRQIQEFNRILLVHAFPDLVVPRPEGSGVLLADGDPQSVAVQTLIQGASSREKIGLSEIPWDVWMPTLKFWGLLALLLGVASVCLVVVVQPQWKRELLPYPIARFVEEATRPGEKGLLPEIMQNNLFWVAFLLVFVIHLFNGLHEWFPTTWFFQIPLQLDFSGLATLFPNAAKIPQSKFVFTAPVLYPTVIGFAFFLASEVSFSVGFSGVLFVALSAILLSNGVLMERDFLEPKNSSMLRFGAYLGLAAIIIFLGRRYYFNLLKSFFGMKRNDETPSNAVWAARIMAVCMAGAVVVLSQSGLDWLLGSLMVALIMLTFFVMTRINVETGTFFIQPVWGVLGVITMVFGIQAIGPTAYITMALVTTLLVLDPREAIMPFVANGMYMSTRKEKKSANTKAALLIGGTVVVSFFVALVSILYLQYNNGIDNQDVWATGVCCIPGLPFKSLAIHLSDLSSYNELAASMEVSGLQRLGMMKPDWVMMRWALLGVVLVLVANAARLRLSWWPLHPVAFVVWGTMPGLRFAPSFIIGWLVKVAVVRFAGAKGFRSVLPMMVGLIAGEMFAALGWMVAGVIYYMVTGLAPETYSIFPG